MRLVINTFSDQLGALIKPEGDDRDMWAISLLLQNPNDTWWDDINTKDKVETRDDVLTRSFQEGYTATLAALGSDRSLWKWGTLHTATFVSNPLAPAASARLSHWLTEAFPGRRHHRCALTPAADGLIGAISRCRPAFHAHDHRYERYLEERLHEPDRSGGNPASPVWRYDKVLAQRHLPPHALTRDQVNAAAAHKLLLTP
jgi:hypothetical protein